MQSKAGLYLSRRRFLQSVGCSALAVCLQPAGICGEEKSAKRPNIVLLLSDDQGWNGLSVCMDPRYPGSKSRFCQTANLEALAKAGMRFSRAYAPAPVCSPTRYSIQTGKTPARLHMTKAARSMTAGDNFRLIPPQGVRQISDNETTIAQLLSRAGYATAHYGKWHLGNGGPGRFGYDEHDGDTGNGDAEAFGGDNPVDIFGMTARACAFVERQSKLGKPFYLQMSYHALHQPQQAREETKMRVGRRLSRTELKDIDRIAMAEDLDEGVGLLVRKIDEVGIADNTFVIYMSDNGAGGKNGHPLRGGKGALWEGGIRVPFIVRGPNVKAGSLSNVPVTGCDLLPTFCNLAGIEDEIPADVDGGSIVGLLASEEGASAKRPREELIFHFPHYQGEPRGPHSAIMVLNHKLVYFWETDESMLFDLNEDISEQKDISEKNPDIAADLKKRLDACLSDADAQLPRPNPGYDSHRQSTPLHGSRKTREGRTKPRTARGLRKRR